MDAEHALIVAHAITQDAGDNRQLEAMAEAAKKALEIEQTKLESLRNIKLGIQTQ